MSVSKEELRQRIDRDVSDYLRRGGVITVVKPKLTKLEKKYGFASVKRQLTKNEKQSGVLRMFPSKTQWYEQVSGNLGLRKYRIPFGENPYLDTFDEVATSLHRIRAIADSTPNNISQYLFESVA